MLLSLGLILIGGLICGRICRILKLPKLIGMLFAGIILGPYVLNLLDDKILMLSKDLREISLLIILIKAGLSLNIKDLKKIGRSSILLSFLPASFEIFAYFIFARIFFDISKIDSLLMGSVIAAVSPAVVVPRMVRLIEEKKGVNKSIPQMILAGASCDDIFVLVLFSSFLSVAKGRRFNYLSILNVPISIIVGVIVGILLGLILYFLFEYMYKKNKLVRNSTKVIIILAISFLLVSLEDYLKNILPMSALLAIIAMASIIKLKSKIEVSKRISEKFGKLWLFSEIILFVLVGAEVDIRYLTNIGLTGFILIVLALIFRSIGTFIAISKNDFNKKEKIFIIISYIPKATVQAAIGSVALSQGLTSGNIILSMAVLSILITAPLGAIFIDKFYKLLLV